MTEFNKKVIVFLLKGQGSAILMALVHVYVRLDNFTTKPRFQGRNLNILPGTKSQSSKNEKNMHVQRARR